MLLIGAIGSTPATANRGIQSRLRLRTDNLGRQPPTGAGTVPPRWTRTGVLHRRGKITENAPVLAQAIRSTASPSATGRRTPLRREPTAASKGASPGQRRSGAFLYTVLQQNTAACSDREVAKQAKKPASLGLLPPVMVEPFGTTGTSLVYQHSIKRSRVPTWRARENLSSGFRDLQQAAAGLKPRPTDAQSREMTVQRAGGRVAARKARTAKVLCPRAAKKILRVVKRVARDFPSAARP